MADKDKRRGEVNHHRGCGRCSVWTMGHIYSQVHTYDRNEAHLHRWDSPLVALRLILWVGRDMLLKLTVLIIDLV
jgi:hypothetical protein